MKENLIDFPCSTFWVGYYAEQGMTEDFPPEYYHNISELEREVKALTQELDAIKDRPVGYGLKKLIHNQGQLAGKLVYLQNRINEHLDEKGRKYDYF